MLTKEEYVAKHRQNNRIENDKTVNATMHMACPRCAEPDWMVYLVLRMREAFEEGAICKHCGFGGKILLSPVFEIVQTAGPDMFDFQGQLRRI